MATDAEPGRRGRRPTWYVVLTAAVGGRAVPDLHDPGAGPVHPGRLHQGRPAAATRSTSSGTSSAGPGTWATWAPRCSISTVVTVIIVGAQLRHRRCWPPTPSPSCGSRSSGCCSLVFMATLMLPIEVTLIPNVETIRDLGWLNSYPAWSAPFLATAFGTFLIRQGFLGHPPRPARRLRARRLRPLAFLRRVAIPVTRPVIASFAVISFLGAWNQYTWPRAVVTREAGGRRSRSASSRCRPPSVEENNIGSRRGHHRRPPCPRAADLPAAPADPRLSPPGPSRAEPGR